MQTTKIKRISTEEVEKLEVYSLALESENEDDVLYVDKDSDLVIKNCLRKDFGMINELFPQTDLLLQAYKINEYLPKWWVDQIPEVFSKKVAILGYTFKRDTDDTRDSLVPKIYRYVQRKNPRLILVHEPHLEQGQVEDDFNSITFQNVALDTALENADIVIVAMNHSQFESNEKIENFSGLVYDIWNITKHKKPSIKGYMPESRYSLDEVNSGILTNSKFV